MVSWIKGSYWAIHLRKIGASVRHDTVLDGWRAQAAVTQRECTTPSVVARLGGGRERLDTARCVEARELRAGAARIEVQRAALQALLDLLNTVPADNVTPINGRTAA